jgi:plasmid stabilization system protein ParE
MITVIYAPKVSEYLNNLIDILYENDYFSYRDSAEEYVIDLLDKIRLSLPTFTHRLPRYRRKVYGKHTKYITIRKNKHTSYYIFFLQKADKYIVTYIGNNHTDAQYL